MGLELLASEFRQSKKNDKDSSINKEETKTEEDLDFWHGITLDVVDDATVATSILNDLLNYDKLEVGSMKLAGDQVLIWDLMSRAVGQFNIQAVNRKVDLHFDFEKRSLNETFADLEMGSECSGGEELSVIGENVRLMQVMRNVISNVLKFTEEDGTIKVSAVHVNCGLPKAPSIMIEDADGVSRPACSCPS